jgi:hypothetical protein
VFYRLPAAMPAGAYRVKVTGYTSANDAHLSADLLLRAAGASDGGTDTVVSTLDGPPPPATSGFGARTWIDKQVCAAALGNAGDGLVLRLSYVSGSSLFGSISTELIVP